MITPIAIALILNGLTLSVALGLLILLLWQDARRLTNLYFAWFLFMVMLWSAGSLLGRGAALTGAEANFIQVGLFLLEVGFTSASLGLYLYVVTLVGNRTPIFQVFGICAAILLFIYYVVLLGLGARPTYTISLNGLLLYEFSTFSVIVFGIIDALILLIVWQGFRRIQRPMLSFGVMLFALGQLVVLASSRLRSLAVGEDTGTLATLIIAAALVQSQIIQPLAGQTRQIRVVRDVGLAVTSRLRLQEVLETIAAQATALIRADASMIFLRRADTNVLILAAHFNIHEDVLGHQLTFDEGLAGRVAQKAQPSLIVDYHRNWNGIPDIPFAGEGFGSVIAVPLIFAKSVMGVLLVINGVDNRLLEREDVRLLELLAPQAAVAITNSRLFEQEYGLKSELQLAKSRLEAFLSSTDNPVIALNKRLEIIFANDAATRLIGVDGTSVNGQSLRDLISNAYFPPHARTFLKDIQQHKSHVYEIFLNDNVYLCHVARIQQPEPGWVAVLNDVTSLKELDRLQRQMIELTTHQLKNPIQGAMLHLDELIDLGEDILTEEMQADVDVIGRQLERMQELIQGILNLERLQGRTVARNEQVDFSQLLHAVTRHLKDHAKNKDVSLKLTIIGDLPLVIGDLEELREAVSNLVDNAIKYTPADGLVVVKAYVENEHILLTIQDDGIGIPIAEQQRIFDRFYRVEQSGTEQIGGTGMGLSFVKTIIENHKGRVWLESEAGHGTTFFVILPILE